MRKKQLIILISFLILVTCFITIASAQNLSEPSLDIVNAAQEGIKILVHDKEMHFLDRFGFLNQKEVDEATLGDGFQVYTVSPNTILNEETSHDLNSMVVPTNMWQFLIMTQNKAASLLTVDRVNDKWTAVSIGASGLATQLSQVIEARPVSKGYQHRLIRVYQATSDFIEISREGQVIGFVPFVSLRIALGGEQRDFNPLILIQSSDLLAKLRPLVRKNIEDHNMWEISLEKRR
jgi:hypothetical protein